MEEENKIPTPKWLKDLQHRSWEPEILLSGIVLYGMFKMPDLLDGYLAYFKLNIFGDMTDVDNLVSLFKMGIYWLITGLILHLICRGIWIGMVGLSYTFPSGIKTEKLKYKGRFKDKVESTKSYERIVIRLEKICSALFSVSFMLFMSLIGGYLFFFVLLLFPFFILYIFADMGFSGQMFDAFQIYAKVILVFALIGLGDFLTLGFFRRFKWFAKIYWPIHRVISALTISRFYRPIYYGMVTNFNKWAFSMLLIAFVVVSIFGTGTMNATFYPGDGFSRLELWRYGNEHAVFSGYYEDQNQNGSSVRAHIPSDIISGDVLRVFMVAQIRNEEDMLEHTSLDSLKEVYPDTARAVLQMMVVRSYFTVFLDEQPVEGISWFFHYSTQTEQRGYVAYLDISTLDEGQHWVDVRGPDGDPDESIVEILFYRDIAINPLAPSKPLKTEEPSPDFQPKPFGIRE